MHTHSKHVPQPIQGLNLGSSRGEETALTSAPPWDKTNIKGFFIEVGNVMMEVVV